MASIAENVNIPSSSSSDATSTKDAECVRVALRIRPLIGKEKIERSHECIGIPDKLRPQVLMGKKRCFTYDQVYGPSSKQRDVYNGSVKSLVDAAFDDTTQLYLHMVKLVVEKLLLWEVEII